MMHDERRSHQVRGSPRPEIRSGDLVMDGLLRPGVVVDDEMRKPIRHVRFEGDIEEVWASDLVATDEREFEMAIIMREMIE
jgi:hypothetical protein